MMNSLGPMALADPPLGTHKVDDPDDRSLLALAEAAWVNHLVARDRQAGLLTRQRIEEAQILTAAALFDMIGTLRIGKWPAQL
jgi:predicted nucleic acid-binding protein